MKILLANKYFYLKGGAETVFFQEREWLAANGHSVIDFSMRHPKNLPSLYDRFFVPEVDYHTDAVLGAREALVSNRIRSALSLIYNPHAALRLNRLLDQIRPDIAHLHNIYHQITPVIIPLLKKKGVKVVMTLHDYKIICPVYQLLNRGSVCARCEGHDFYRVALSRCKDGSVAKSLILCLEAYFHKWRKSYEAVDLFIAPSRFMKMITARYRLDEKRIRVLHNGVDCERISPSDEDAGYGLYFGRLSGEKGIETLLRAHEKLRATCPLKVVGTGPVEARLREKYPRASFAGYLSGRALTDVIRQSAFVVAPSEWYENCSMAVLEAMALGKPVIASDIGGLPEQIRNGVNGYLFTPGDSDELAEKMALLHNDPKLRRRMGDNGRRILEDAYDFSAHGRDLMRIYEEVLAS